MTIICIEGPDGVGKTSVAKYLSDQLGATYMRAPGHTQLGELLRPTLKDAKSLSVPVKCLLFQAVDIDVHLEAQRLSEAGQTVVMDRCGLSDWIYRSAANEQFGRELMSFLHLSGLPVFMPKDAHVLVLQRSDELLDRACGSRGVETDEGSRFKDHVRENYRKFSKVAHTHVLTLDTSDDCLEQTAARIVYHMETKPQPTVPNFLAVACALIGC